MSIKFCRNTKRRGFGDLQLFMLPERVQPLIWLFASSPFACPIRKLARLGPGIVQSFLIMPKPNAIRRQDDEIFEIFKQDAPRLGINPTQVSGYRVIRHLADSYLLSPHMNKLRPGTRTANEGLFLAGDYVQQSFMATVEGAIISGNSAAREVKMAARTAS